MIVDGSYYSFDLAKKAFSKGIELIPGELTGKKTDNDKLDFNENFDLDEEQKQIEKCANDKRPYYTEKNNDTYYGLFKKMFFRIYARLK